MSILDLGAGASEGLDTLLQRMMLEQKQKEIERSNQADEGLRKRGLDQNEPAIRALAEDRAAQTQARTAAAGAEQTRTKQEQDLLDDPNTDPAIKKFLGLRRVVPKGETIPPELVTGPKKPNSQVKTVTYKGKPVDANYDPQSQTFTYQGQDITKDVGHYEKPPAPDRVLIQTGSGYTPRADATAKLKAGGSVPLATTSSTRTMTEGAQMLQPHIDSLNQQAEALDKAGLFGPIMSRVRDIANKVGTIDEFSQAMEDDPELNKDKAVGKFATSLGLMASGAGRVHGGARGGGNVQMYNNFKALLSDAGTLDLFKGHLEGLDEYMTGYAKGPGGADNKPGESGGLPQVGGTFQGGKVTKVTPIPK